MLDIVLNYLWMTIVAASLVTCAVAATIVYVTRKLD
jgi:hypothetical protein